MNYFKKIGISFIYILTCLISLTFIITIFNYFNILNDKITSIFKIFIPIISLFIGGFIIGKKTNNKGFIEGLKLGLIYSFLLILFNLIFLDFKFKYLLFYVILITSCILGSMVGINIKKEK